MLICVMIGYYFTLKNLACTICILISCIGHSLHLNVGLLNDVFDRVEIRTCRLDYIRVILFIWHIKLFKITKEIISSQMFDFAFFLWFSANIVTHVI